MFATPRVPVSGSSSIKVFVRVRPLLAAEHEEGARNIIHASSTEKQVTIEDGSEKFFKYDGVLDEDVFQEEMYNQAVAPLVKRVKEGFNATVLAYGQTGSGKTFTMGTHHCVKKEKEGILQRALQDLLVDENDPPSNGSTTYQLKISMLEIYGETVFDLLASKNELKKKNEIGGGASVIGLIEEHVDTIENGLALLEKGTLQRSMGTTAMNNRSSRSHALIFLTVKHRNHEACLKLVDLAGAEGVGRAQSSGLQFTEGVNINKGLLTLGKVLVALSNSSAYVPYRESLLTRILKDSLGRDGFTTMIACVNPSSSNIHETINTLRYAEQARNIKARVHSLSTIKKTASKRRLEDVSASGEAWKKHIMSTEKVEHNSTISTPGHKPSVRKLAPYLNMTVTTPCEGLAAGFPELASGLLPISEKRDNIGKSLFPSLPPPHMCPSLAKFPSEDCSPSGLSTVSANEERSSSPYGNSSFMDHFTNHFEQTMMAQLDNLGDRVAESIVDKLTQKKGNQKREKSKTRSKSKCSTPTEIDNSLGAKAEFSSGNILEETIAHAFLAQSKMKAVLQEAFTHALGQFMKNPSDPSNKDVADEMETKLLPSEFISDPKLFSDMTDLSHLQEIQSVKEKQELDKAVFETPSLKHIQENMNRNFPITSTAVCNTRMVRRSTRLSTRKSLHSALMSRLSPKISHESKESCITDISVDEANVTAIEADLDSSRLDTHSRSSNKTFGNQSNQNTKLEKMHRRKSTRLAAVKATKKNFTILQSQSPLSNTGKKQFYKKGNISVHSVSSKAKPSIPNTTLANQSYAKMASPRQQEKHNDSILTILNTGSLKELQQLPTIGPKTAMVLNNYRKLYGKFERIEEIEGVPGLSKSFYNRFMTANLLTGLLQHP